MRNLILLFLFTQNLHAADGAHGFITYLQTNCSGQTQAEKVLYEEMNKLDAFSFQKDVLLRKMELAKFKCLKARLSDYAFLLNPKMKEINEQREYRVIFTQLAIYSGALSAERSRANFVKDCSLVRSDAINDCTKQLSEKLVNEYVMLSAIDKLLTAVGEAMDKNPEWRFSKVQALVERKIQDEIKRTSARAKAAKEASLPARVR